MRAMAASAAARTNSLPGAGLFPPTSPAMLLPPPMKRCARDADIFYRIDATRFHFAIGVVIEEDTPLIDHQPRAP